MSTTQPLTEQIRRAARESGRGQNALARAAGIDKGSFSKFLSGQRGLSLGGLNRLSAVLGLVVTAAPGPAPDALAFMRQFIAARRWKFAETYAKTAPHEYTVRGWRPGPRDQADFERFVTLVRERGRDAPWGRRVHRYLEVDGFKYWTMGAPVGKTTVINREPLAGPAGAAVRGDKKGG